jgi:hypothetical protein
MRAAAAAASQPAWPAPTTKTSNLSEKLDTSNVSEKLAESECAVAGAWPGLVGDAIWFDFSGFWAAVFACVVV